MTNKKEKEKLEKRAKYVPIIEEYIKTASPYPTVEEFCVINDLDIHEVEMWALIDNDFHPIIRKLHLKAYTALEKYLILDTKTITFGKDGKEYKLDKKGLIYKLEELKRLLAK